MAPAFDEARPLEELREEDGYIPLWDSQDIAHFIEYCGVKVDDDVTGAVIRAEVDSNGDMVDVSELWVTYSSRPYEIYAQYERVF